MIFQARVTAVHPEDNSVDIVTVRDGVRYPGVQVLCNSASYNTGTADLPSLGAGSGNRWSLAQRTDRELIALCAMMEGNGGPVVVGFIFPQVNGVLFAEQDRRIMRHGSDVYSTIDKDGNIELAHPSGAFVRIATDPEHENLSGKDVDGNWAITKNTGQQVWLSIKIGPTTMRVSPTGAITLDTPSTIDVTAGGAVTVAAPSATVSIPNTTWNGSIQVNGSINVTGGDVVADGIGLKTHKHTGVQAGPSNTGGPTP